jgi:hypothetical protein
MPRALPVARILVLAVAALALPSCLECKETGMVNPDGSGKATIDLLVNVPAAAGAPPAAAIGKQVAARFLATAQGVEAWKDITIDVAPDGRSHVVATAYFPDISKFKLDAPITMTWAKNGEGGFTFVMKKDQAAAPTAPPPMADDKVAQAIAEAKDEYKQSQPGMQMVLGTLKISVGFTLPGNVMATNILTKKADGSTVAMAIDGKSMIAAMDKIYADDKVLAVAVKAGENSPVTDELLMENLFGKKGQLSATVAGPVKDLFDYKAEMAAAKAAEPQMLKKLNLVLNPSETMPASQPAAK